MVAYYNAYKYGMEARMDAYDGKVQKGDVFPVKVTVENSAGEPIRNVQVSLDLPYQMYCVGESEVIIPEVPAEGSETVEFQVLALEGGRGMIQADVRTADDVALSFSEGLSISGQGYYAGDNHTHSIHSDGKGTIRENVDSAYEDKLLNWLYSTDHNKISQGPDTVEETNRLAGNFISITGTEITSSGKGHALAYGVGTFVPEYRIGKEIEGKIWTWRIPSIRSTTTAASFMWPIPTIRAWYSPIPMASGIMSVSRCGMASITPSIRIKMSILSPLITGTTSTAAASRSTSASLTRTATTPLRWATRTSKPK